MHQASKFKVEVKNAWLTPDTYKNMYQESVKTPDIFWSRQAKEFVTWDKEWDNVLKYDYVNGEVEWFEGAKLNVSYNCLDRHLPTKKDKTAIIWEGNEPGEGETLTYQELYERVCQFANLLKKNGVKRGDRIVIYLPITPTAVVSMLACARIGAIHSVVFAGFSAESLKARIIDCEAKLVITANEGVRGAKSFPLKEIVDNAVNGLPFVEKVLVYKRTNGKHNFIHGRDEYIDEALKDCSKECEPVVLSSNDPLFILYTSGSTGKPKGVIHTQGGYILYVSMTHKYIFNLHEDDIYFCTADIGWITGHSYVVYGPLANGATTVLFEPIPTYPDPSRYWSTIEKTKATIFYTAPTAIRSLAKEDISFTKKNDLSSLRILGSVGEPINEEAWLWYFKNIGKEKLSIVDTWWQTETGGILASPIPGVNELKPGAATKPFFGVIPVIKNKDGDIIKEPNTEGNLCITFPWPGQMVGVYGDKNRFKETYFSQYPGSYFTGDAARIDEDGDLWIIGRVDDVLNVSGHRIGTAEVEGAITSSGVVVESAVVGVPHDVKGEAIFAFCVLFDDIKKENIGKEELAAKIKDAVKKELGSFATPDHIAIVNGLPRTRSGKIMRRIVRKVARKEFDSIGDTSTLADPAIVAHLMETVNGPG